MKKKCCICNCYFNITGSEKTTDDRTLCKKCRMAISEVCYCEECKRRKLYEK